jgi:hypothetical protein
MTELDEDDELHLEMHRAVDELGKFSLHMKVDFGKNVPAEKAISFVEQLLIKATDACLDHGADLVGHVKAFMMVEDGSTVGFSLIHHKMKINITRHLRGESIKSAEVIVHVIVHGIWDPEVREQTLKVLEAIAREMDVRFEIIKDFYEIEKSAAHHGG